MNLDSSVPDRPTIICERCRIFRIYFDQKQRNRNGVLIPLEVRTGQKHYCDFSEPKYCECGILIYFDDKILSAGGKKIPLEYGEDTYHHCCLYPKGKGPVKQ